MSASTQSDKHQLESGLRQTVAAARQGDYRSVRNMVTPLLREYPDDPRLLLLLGVADIRDGKKQEGLEKLRKAAMAAPERRLAAIDHLKALGMLQEALELVEQGLESNQNNEQLLKYRSTIQKYIRSMDEIKARPLNDKVLFEPGFSLRPKPVLSPTSKETGEITRKPAAVNDRLAALAAAKSERSERVTTHAIETQEERPVIEYHGHPTNAIDDSRELRKIAEDSLELATHGIAPHYEPRETAKYIGMLRSSGMNEREILDLIIKKERAAAGNNMVFTAQTLRRNIVKILARAEGRVADLIRGNIMDALLDVSSRMEADGEYYSSVAILEALGEHERLGNLYMKMSIKTRSSSWGEYEVQIALGEYLKAGYDDKRRSEKLFETLTLLSENKPGVHRYIHDKLISMANSATETDLRDSIVVGLSNVADSLRRQNKYDEAKHILRHLSLYAKLGDLYIEMAGRYETGSPIQERYIREGVGLYLKSGMRKKQMRERLVALSDTAVAEGNESARLSAESASRHILKHHYKSALRYDT